MAVKLKGFHELLPSLTPARDDERRDRPVAAPACQLGGSLVRGAGFQPGVENLFHFAAPFQEFGHNLGVLAVSLHAQAQRFQALQEQESIERRDGRSDVAQQLHTGFDDVGACA